MKRISFLLFILAFFTVSTYAVGLDYNDNEPVTKRLKLNVNENAVEGEAFVQWELRGDWDLFEYSFSQGVVDGNTFTVYAKDYRTSVNGEEGILLTIKGKKKTSKGNYLLEMVIVKATDNLVVSKDKMNLKLPIEYEPYHKTIFEIMLPYIIILVVILLIMLLLNNMAKFPKGLLQVGTDTVKLKGKKMVSVKAELAKLNPNVQLGDGVDVVFVKKKFASFQGPCLKVASGCTLMRNGLRVTKGSVIRLGEEIEGLSDKDGNPIVIRYCY